MTDPAEELRRLTELRPISELEERHGMVLLWWLEDERPEVGELGDSERWRVVYCNEPAYWSPIPKVEAPNDGRDCSNR